MLYRMIQSSGTILTEIIWEIIQSIKFEKLFFSDSSLFPSDDFFYVDLLYIIVIIWRGFRAKSLWKCRELEHSFNTLRQ
jgi:hypothetical protein